MMINGSPQVRTCCRGTIAKVFVCSVLAVTFYLSFNPVVFAINLNLIEPFTLKQNLSSWVILDARPRSEWMAGHIPGALPFSWEDYTKTDENGMPDRVWLPQELAKAIGEMGIDENTPILVYGDADKRWEGEGWNCLWMLAWLGHKGPIRLLAGGMHAWRSNNLPLETGASKVKIQARRYQVKLNPQFDISTEELKKTKSGLILIDTRSTLELLKGKIPGAIHISWTDFYSGKDKRPLSADALKKLLQKHGVDLHKPIVYYCSEGIRSAYAWLVHQLAGLPVARNYEGGFEAWKRRSSK